MLGIKMYKNLFKVNLSTINRGIDLRKEFDTIVYGDASNTRQGWPHLLRVIRRNSDGSGIKCTCFNELSAVASPSCAYCLGEGYLWDEEWKLARSEYLGAGGLASRYRIAPPGEIRADTKVFFFRYDTVISYGDKIIEIKLDEEGNYINPIIRTAIYRPETIRELRGDNGRIEFISVFCLEKDAIRSDNL